MPKLKTVKLSEEAWKGLMQIKLDAGLSTLDEAVKALLRKNELLRRFGKKRGI